jgi:hypothetical protein
MLENQAYKSTSEVPDQVDDVMTRSHCQLLLEVAVNAFDDLPVHTFIYFSRTKMTVRAEKNSCRKVFVTSLLLNNMTNPAGYKEPTTLQE